MCKMCIIKKEEEKKNENTIIDLNLKTLTIL